MLNLRSLQCFYTVGWAA